MRLIDSKRNTALATIAGVALLVGGVETVQAALISQTESFSFSILSESKGGQTFTFDPFDSSLGTLTKVEYVLDSSTNTAASVGFTTTIPDDASANTKIDSSFIVEIAEGTAFGGTLFVTAEATCGGNLLTCFSSVSEPRSFSGTEDFSSFYPNTLEAILTLDVFGYLEECFANGGSCVHDFSAQWEGTLTLNYTYDAANTVPTPSSLLLLSAGLAALGVSRRRSKARRKGSTG